MFLRQLSHALLHVLAHARSVVDQVLILVDIDHGVGGRAGHGVCTVRQADRQRLVRKMLHDLLAHDDAAQRDVAAGKALRHAQDVRHHAVVVDTEPFSGAPEAAHHLVADGEDAIFVRDGLHAFPVAGRIFDTAAGAAFALHQDRSDVFRSFELHHTLHVRQRALGAFLRRLTVPWAAVEIRVLHMDDVRHALAVIGQAARVTACGKRAVSGTVVTAIERDDLMPAGVQTGELDRVLDRIRATVGEESAVERARSDLAERLAQLAARLGDHARVDVAHLGHLLGHGLRHFRVPMTDVHVHQLRAEVDDLPAIAGLQVDAFGALDIERVQATLFVPREDGVLEVLLEDIGGIGLGLGAHQVVSILGRSANELVRYRLYFIQDLPDQRPADVLALMMRKCSVAPIRMSVENMTPFLSHDLEAPSEQDAFKCPCIHDRQFAHTAIEKDCRPTNAGSALMSSSLISSRQSSTTSFRFA